MALPHERLDGLRELLKQCSARVVPDGGNSHGTGFFIADRLLLTCAHVVKGDKGARVSVQPFGRADRPGEVVEVVPDKETGDIALVDVEAVAGEGSLPAVVLDHAIGDGIDYIGVGYPKEKIAAEGGIEAIAYKGHRSTANDGTVILLKLDSGQGTVGSGMSGGAVINAESGAVVAMIQYSEGTAADSGGSAIPIARAQKAFTRVAELLAEAPSAAERWRLVLGQTAWEALHKVWEPRRWVDVVVDGSSCGWRIKVGTDQSAPLEVSAVDLPAEVSEALFRWSQRRRVRDSNEVRLLGRLLASAVFPADVANRIQQSGSPGGLLVRLRFEGDSDLFDVPWEFATVPPKGGEKYLAAMDGGGLVRIAPHPHESQVVVVPAAGKARVVGVVIHPNAWQKFMPKLGDASSQADWPKVGKVAEELRKDVLRPGTFTFTEPPDAQQFTVQTALAPDPADGVEIVHYIGFGRFWANTAQLAFARGDGDVEWRDAMDVFDWVAQSDARLLVVQFVLPRFDYDMDPVPPRTFLSALSSRVNAVLFTRFPVHPQQCHTFNAALYRVLADGGSIEAAVQQARIEVAGNQFLGDAAGFGSFTLVTGPTSDMRFVEAKGKGGPTDRQSGQSRAEPEPEQTRRDTSNISFTPSS